MQLISADKLDSMMKCLALILLMCLLGCNSQEAKMRRMSDRSPFAIKLGSPGIKEDCQDIVVDRAENFYCAGNMNNQAMITKYNNQGELIWFKRFTIGTNNSGCYSIGIDAADNVYCGGMLGVGNFTSQANTTTNQFIVKINSDGDLVWSKEHAITNAGYDDCRNIYVTPKGEVICAASAFYGSIRKAVIAKLDVDGNMLWHQLKGTTGLQSCGAVAVDSEDTIFCIGSTSSNLGDTLAGINDAFVWKYKPAIYDNVFHFGSNAGISFNLSKDALHQVNFFGKGNEAVSTGVVQGNSLYITGYTSGNLGEENSNWAAGHSYTLTTNWDIFVLKLNVLNGQIEWLKQFGKVTPLGNIDTHRLDYAEDLILDPHGNLIFGGWTDSGSKALDEAGTNYFAHNALVFSLTSDGEFRWGKIFGEDKHEKCIQVFQDSEENIYCGGYTSENVELSDTNSSDALILRFDPSGNLISN